MALTKQQKKNIREETLRYASRFATRNQCASALQISVAQFSTAITSGKIDGVLSDAKWTDIARKIGVSLKDRPVIKTAMTKMVLYLVEQFEVCQKNSTSGILCDIADSGKTQAAKYYASIHKGAIRVDCSIFKSKRRLINEIARQLGVPRKGNYWDQYDSLVWQINNSDTLLIILDEAGDLQYDAFLEVKGLWNATEGNCGWFLLGADALREKMERCRRSEKVGYQEMFSRLGAKYQSCIRSDAEGRKEDMAIQAAMIAKLNTASDTNIQKLVMSSDGSLRRLINTIQKDGHNVCEVKK